MHEKNGPRAILTAFVKRIALGSFLLVHTPARMALGPLLFFKCTMKNGPRVILVCKHRHNQIQTLNNGLWAILVCTHHSKNDPRAILFSLNVCVCKSISKNGPRAILAYIHAHTHIET